MRLLIALGEGGHTKEMLALVDALGPDLEYAYLVVRDDEVSESKIRRPGPVYHVLRPRDKKHNFVWDACKSLYSGFQSWRVLRVCKPDAVLSTGPSVAVPVCVLAKLSGVKVIFVECGCRITALSLTGKIMYRVADLFFVQWPDLAARLPRATYAGRLF